MEPPKAKGLKVGSWESRSAAPEVKQEKVETGGVEGKKVVLSPEGLPTWRSAISPRGPAAPRPRSHAALRLSPGARGQIKRSGVQGQSDSAKREISFFQLTHSALKEQFLSSER